MGRGGRVPFVGIADLGWCGGLGDFEDGVCGWLEIDSESRVRRGARTVVGRTAAS